MRAQEIRLDVMDRIIRWWMEFDKQQRDKEGLETTDDTLIMSPPDWPSHGQLRAWSETLQEAVKREKAADWQPIETASRDETVEVLTWNGTSISVASHLHEDRWHTMGLPSHAPTHWMPLPEPPK